MSDLRHFLGLPDGAPTLAKRLGLRREIVRVASARPMGSSAKSAIRLQAPAGYRIAQRKSEVAPLCEDEQVEDESAYEARGDANVVYTVGHSNHRIEQLLVLLSEHGVDAVADVRTSPHSRFSPQFNRDELKRSLRAVGVDYVFLGKELGGRPTGAEFYDAEGHVRYDRVSSGDAFEHGIERLLRGAQGRRVALMCSEADPAQCHRHLLIARVLDDRGVTVLHIEADGSVSSYTAVAERTPIQEALFDEGKTLWRSPRSVFQGTPPSRSSDDYELPASRSS